MWGDALLTQKKYTDAAAKLKELVDNHMTTYNTDLLPNYSDIFSVSNEMNKEIIFAVRYTAGQNPIIGSPFSNLFMPIGADGILTPTTTYSGNSVTTDLVNAFESGDLRLAASVGSMHTSKIPVDTLYSKKYLNSGAAKLYDGNNDWIVYRYADVLLMYADALNESGNTPLANNYVTLVRQRAGLSALSPASQADLRTMILHESRVELNMEGKRWFDLARRGLILSVLQPYFTANNIRQGGTPIEAYRVLFPIPLTEIQVNPKLGPNNNGYN